MNRRTRRAARVTTALVAVGILLAPSQALADTIEPEPVEWPKVKPANGPVVEPQPVDWPTPAKP
ncbi:hypothetical protein EV651_103366 [Kribbella sp. VKM Ac-2571]|uniref:hypothetical protein n=1 Tax=Kribbella sp. VKM Ac-2571 TaxID=2512222 RepID=UPI0010606AAD|nr:hypothetical protein [Kribbella sp. VKM Ac-2571]TDO67454.1 hypothetical protein EV651_103366 [Kribbella sp. VKM Ac-2571]